MSPASAQTLDRAVRAVVRGVKNQHERRTLIGLIRELKQLPGNTSRAAIETGAALASVSLRAGMEFLRVARQAAQVLDAGGLRQWGEMGRRLAITDGGASASFFAEGAAHLNSLPVHLRSLLFDICLRQMGLSIAVALDTFRRAPLTLAHNFPDARLLARFLAITNEIARRSARHSADFVNASTAVAARLEDFNEDKLIVGEAALNLAEVFALRAGGMASDLWVRVPVVLRGLDKDETLKLFGLAERFLERGGAIALGVLEAGGEVLRLLPEVFDEWTRLLETVVKDGNPVLNSLTRASPASLRGLFTRADRAHTTEIARRVITATIEVARVDAEAALLCLRSAPVALRRTGNVEAFERWAHEGLASSGDNARARRSYFALETRRSNEQLASEKEGLQLEEVAHTLRLYVEALTNRTVEVAPLAASTEQARINDGRTIHLPSVVAEFEKEELNFRLYKVLAAHAAGQIEFGTHEVESDDLQAAYDALGELYAPENLDARDAFALDGYINDLSAGEKALTPEEELRRLEQSHRPLPRGADYRVVLALFPQTTLAARIFGTLENGRIDRRLRHMYRGLRRDLDFVSHHLRRNRPLISRVPTTLVPFELLFQITLCGGALDDAREFYPQIASELESIVIDYLNAPTAAVADTLMATSRVYALFQAVVPDESSEQQSEATIEDADAEGQEEAPQRETKDAPPKKKPTQEDKQPDARELFNAWAQVENLSGDELDGNDAQGAHRETPAQDLEPGDVAYAYDEWDRELLDHRVSWCRVIEKRVRRGDRSFVELARSRHRGLISSIRHQFQLIKPEGLRRIQNELDGDDYDLNAVIDYVVDRRAALQTGIDTHSERLYTRRLRRDRDVAVAFLLDQSSSTARTIGRHPLQPYTHPGRRIIEVEKEGLVLMSEALEAVGDPYAIYGFTSEGRRNVRFYIVKEFGERYDAEVERRIGGINYQNNTRLGAAIRHAAAKLARQDARTRLLIILSDGRPYDHDYGDARYAREDTREALAQARIDNITPFCITIDRDSEHELRELYGEVGYTIIDDVLSLPERMPAIYRRLTA
ncbi:MAG: VWA domain-containing protein [Pyrinomonadaceae bacterium]|nr:VWA domain-containing protein [Pyrinomonadaceae bacterium]